MDRGYGWLLPAVILFKGPITNLYYFDSHKRNWKISNEIKHLKKLRKQWITYKPLKRISESPKEGYYNMIPSRKVFISWFLIIKICVEWEKVKTHELSMVSTVCQIQNLGQNLFHSVILCVRLSHKNRT